MGITINNLNFTYPDGRAGLRDINLKIKPGRKTGILGLNGSGKSTLLTHFNGMKSPDSGEIFINNIKVEKKNLNTIRQMIGYIFDFPDHQLFSTTVYKDLEFGLDNYKYEEEIKIKRIDEISKVLQIEDLLDFPPFHLSLGQKKRVALGGVLVMDPQVLILDEPFSGLDNESVKFFIEYLDNWIDENKTLVFSTHDTDMTYNWADDVIVIDKGSIVTSGDKTTVMNNPEIYELGLKKPFLYELFEDIESKPQSISEAKKLINI